MITGALPKAGFTVGLVFLLSLCTSCHGEVRPHPGNSLGIEAYPGTKDLYRFAERQRAKHSWPALGVGIIHKGKIVGLGMAGERHLGSMDWTTLGDLFDVGSTAKSITATVAAILVSQNKLRWDSTVAEAFPELKGVIRPEYESVTLEQLLGHRSGLDQWMNSNVKWAAWHRENSRHSATEKRMRFVKAALERKPRYAPGTEHYYCNDGYVVAAAMMEKILGEPWENAVRSLIFQPLRLDSMRFGPPGGHPASAAWGHELRSFSRLRSVKPDPAEYGDPPFGSPGGFLYCTVPDLLRYVDVHIQGTNAALPFLTRESFDRLHAPLKGQNYALGWVVEITRDPKGRVVERSIHHGGYSGRSRAQMWFCPETQWGTVIVCNDGRGDDSSGLSEVFFALLREFELIK